MEITSLGNCPSTLLADPMAIDGEKLRAYIDATASAGFDAVSLWAFHLMFAGPDSNSVVRDSGLDVSAVEACIGWTAGPNDALSAEIDGLIGTGVDLGATIVGAACLGTIDDHPAAVEGMAAIAERAAEADMRIALEFLPWTGVPTLAAADDLVTATGAANATILLDLFHWIRQPGGPDLDLLRSLPGERISYVQLCEPSAAPTVAAVDIEDEAMHARRLPGAGAVDHPSIWDALDKIGSTPFVAAEVFNDELVGRGPASMAQAVHDACRGVLP